MGSGFTLGQVGGQYAHTLTISEMPQHIHAMMGVDANGDNVVPTGAFLGGVSNQYGPATNLTTLSPSTVSQVGGNQPHENTQPYNTLSCCIALQGIFPSQS
jgi:microcystin-dependent protein